MNSITAKPPVDRPFTFNGITFYSPEHHFDRPKMQWLVDGIFPETGLGCVYGSPGTGKSFLCLDIAARVSLGQEWFGRKAIPSSVLYIALEGKQGFQDRIKAWESHNETKMPTCVRFTYDKLDITDGKAISNFVCAINECDKNTKLIIIDTLNRASPGADENSSKDMGEIISGASALQADIGGLVLLVHHDGKDATRGLRGHSSLLGALDVALKVETIGNHYQWRLAKLKDGVDGIKHEFRLVETKCTSDKDDAITSLAVQPEGNSSIAEKQRKALGKHQATVLASLKILLSSLAMHDKSATITLDEAVKSIQDDLVEVESKHRSTRTKEALHSLIKQDYLHLNADQYLSLANAQPEAQN